MPCFRYHGMDIVPSVIDANQQRFRSDPQTTFSVGELSSSALPNGADLVLCRDALQHLPLLAGVSLLENIARSKPRLVLVGSYLGPGTRNRNVRAGEYYDINLVEGPYNLTNFIDAVSENTPTVERNKYLLVFDGDAFATVDFAKMRVRAEQFISH